MKKLTIFAAIAAVAMAMTAPLALAQTTYRSDMAPPVALSRDHQAAPGMMGAQGQTQGQSQEQGAYGPVAMGGYAQSQDRNGPGMMDGHRYTWMREFGGIWMLILLFLTVAGFVAWIVKEDAK